MSQLSTDDFLIPVTLLVPEGANSSPTTDVVQFAFLPIDSTSPPQPADWNAGFWLNTGAQLLDGITVGPSGTVNPGPGKWAGWIKIEDSPTVPVQQVDTLTIV